jgi:hypothetical protein
MNNTNQIKIADMGTTGLVNWVITGARTQRWESVNAFCKCVNRALGF